MAKQELIKQALWQIYLLVPRYIPVLKFNILVPNLVYLQYCAEELQAKCANYFSSLFLEIFRRKFT